MTKREKSKEKICDTCKGILGKDCFDPLHCKIESTIIVNIKKPKKLKKLNKWRKFLKKMKLK